MKARRLPLEVEVAEIEFVCSVKVGDMFVPAVIGDYLVKNAFGETYPVERDLFLRQYKIVEERNEPFASI